MPPGEREPALELVIVVAVEQVVLAIVLVVQDSVGRGEARLEQAALGPSLAAGAIGPLAPAKIGLGEIAVLPPDPLVDQGLQTGAIGPGLRPENPIAGAQRRLVAGDALGFESLPVGRDTGGERIGDGGLVERGDRAYRAVEQVDQAGKGIAKEAGNPQRDVDP